jgi:hypothetical protein
MSVTVENGSPVMISCQTKTPFGFTAERILGEDQFYDFSYHSVHLSLPSTANP